MYAKFVSETYVNKKVPSYADIGGIRYFNIAQNAAILKQIGFLPLTETEMPSDAPDDKHYVRKYKVKNEAIEDFWVLVDDPVKVHTYKKSYLAQWFWGKNRLEDLENFMGLDATAKFFWDYSTEFDSNHPQWNTLLDAMCNALGITDEERAEMLQVGEYGPRGA